MGNTIKIQPEFGFSTNISSEDIKKFADLYGYVIEIADEREILITIN